MAVTTKRRRRSSWLWLFVRGLAVLGLFAALLGAIGCYATPGFDWKALWHRIITQPAALQEYIEGTPDRYLRISLWMLLGGSAVALLALVFQLIAGVFRLAGRRNLAGTNAALQTACVVFLLIAVNYFSFRHYQRFDWTGRQFASFGWRSPLEPSNQFRPQFTLPESVATELKQLRDETTIVVYQRHKTIGQINDKPDAFDYAAERKIVEKVQDLVRLFREFGPQFRVVLLDVEDQSYDQKLKQLTDRAPAMRKSIDTAPDNSIIFHSRRGDRESVQRLSFNEFFRLDKSDSRAANNGRGNLVLLPQGVESFARRVLAIEEKKPKIGLAVIHEWLTTEGLKEFSSEGLRKALELQGFEVTDIVLKKGWNEGEPTAAAYTLGENQFERLESELAEIDTAITSLREDVKRASTVLEKLKSNIALDDLNNELQKLQVLPPDARLDERSRQANALKIEPQVELLREIVAQQEKERAETLKQLEQIPNQERIAENRRQTDVKEKFAKLLSEVDLLIVPRITLRNVVVLERIPAKLYRLDEAQSSSIQDFMKAGKPVLALFGPANEPPERRPSAPAGPEKLETMFTQLGIVFGKQTILYNAEQKAFAQRRVSLLAGAADVEIPPVYIRRPKSSRQLVAENEVVYDKPNPIAESMSVVAAATGHADQLVDVKVRHPRPVYFEAKNGASAFAPEFLFSDPESWNESDPFPTRERTPRYEPIKPDDPRRGTRDAPTRGPFPIGVAVETKVPSDWLKPKASGTPGEPLVIPAGAERDVQLRVAAIGQGDIFSGTELSSAREQLLVNTCNWLLGRDERLPHANQPSWSFPRVQLSERCAMLWRLGALIALPAFFAFLGATVLLVRKYR